jgi:XisH protein
MPRKDIYHDTVKIALEKEGWVIIKENLNLSVDDTPLYADLGAEAVFVAERKGEKAAFEVKTFGGQSFVTNLHEAVGQYGVYKSALELVYPTWNIYLAVPEPTYLAYFLKPFIQKVMKDHHINMIVYNTQNQIITQWILH